MATQAQTVNDLTMRDPMAVAESIMRNDCPDTRLAGVLLEARRLLPHNAWRLFHTVWPTLAPSWHDECIVLQEARRMQVRALGVDHLSAPDRAAFDLLPDTLTVYRGCAQEHVSGLRWTLDRQQAEADARAARGGVVAEVITPKRNFFAIYSDRGEVLLDANSYLRIR